MHYARFGRDAVAAGVIAEARSRTQSANSPKAVYREVYKSCLPR